MNNQAQAEKKVRVKARLDHITYPRSGQISGSWTIATFNLLEVLEGDFPIELEWKNQFVAKGKMPALNNTDTYIISAFVIEDEKYGLQLETESMYVDYNLDDIEEQKKFFSFFLTPNQVEILYSQFEDPMRLLKERDIDSLIKAKGIGPVTAQRMITKYEDCQDKGLAYVKFYDLGLTKGAIDKLVKFYGSPEAAVAVIENNPYTLIIQVPGYGWNKADAIALAQGLTLDCPERMGAYLVHYLREQAEINGNSWVNVDDLCLAIEQVCGPTDQEKVYEVVRRGIRDKTLYFDNVDGRIGLTEYRRLEENLADEIVRIQNGSAAIPIDERKAKEVLAKVEKEQGFGFTEEQNAAIWNTLNSQFSILTGLGGTGKTSAVNGIAHVLREHNYRVAQVSLSGRAASKLTEITHIPGQTIHRLLGYDPESGGFHYNKENPVPYDIIIGDEVSMWGGEITLDLLRAVPNGAKVLFIGDPKQLEAIGLASVLTDTIKSQTIPTVQLTKIQRQKADSGIITQSLKVACGEQIVSANSTGTEYRGALRDFKLVTYIDAGLTQSKIIDEFNELYKEKGVPAKDIQVLVPMRSKGEASCRALNIAIQEIVNGCPQRNEVTINYVDGNFKYCYTYRKNDRVIIMKNNYKTINTEGHKEPIFNGNVGYIKEIGPDYMIINLTEQGDIILTEDNYDNLSLAYAITVHKKQGDSSPYVIGAIDSSSYALISKELLYTMITRARKYCVIVGQKRILQQAVKISRVKTKQTWLKELLQAKEAAKAAKESICE
jgi:exodeoxyribonuclease V alpha subunit